MPASGLTDRLTSSTGTYALVFECARTGEINIGSLGVLSLMPGYYLYVGSAFGPGGMRARLRHHLHQSAVPHWHIDYLKPHCGLCETWLHYSATKHEADWAATLSRHENATVPLAGFGASDTPARTHLFHFKTRPRAGLILTIECVEIIRINPDSPPG